MALLSGLLPFLTLAFLARMLVGKNQRWPLAAGKALLLWGSSIWIFSEIASTMGRLNSQAAFFFWGLSSLFSLWSALRSDPNPAPAGPRWPWWALALLTAYLALLGLRMPATNYDVMFYHLPRVEQWAQQSSLVHFPTSYDLQLFYPPWAEMAILQTRLLCGNELWAPWVQGAAFVGLIAGVAQLALELSSGKWGAILAASALAALPMANLQASTCQNDLAAALWVLWASVFVLRFHRSGRSAEALWAAAALGLGLATKGTSYLYGLPWGLWLALVWLKRSRLHPIWLPLGLVALILLPSAGHWSRNLSLSGKYLGSAEEHRVKPLTLAGAGSNLIKNLGDDAFSSDRAWNQRVRNGVRGLHRLFGWELNDPHQVWPGYEYGHFTDWAGSWHDDYAGSPWHLLGGLLLLLAVLLGWRRDSLLTPSLVCLGTGYLLYAVLVRHNPWDTRLHLSALVPLCSALGLGLEALAGARLPGLLAAALLAQSGWIAGHHLNQSSRIFLPGQVAVMHEKTPYWDCGIRAGQRAASLGTQVGLWCQERQWEFPLWATLQKNGVQRIQHLHASSSSASLLLQPPWKTFQPDVLIRDEPANAPPILEVNGRRWARDLVTSVWVVYRRLEPK